MDPGATTAVCLKSTDAAMNFIYMRVKLLIVCVFGNLFGVCMCKWACTCV